MAHRARSLVMDLFGEYLRYTGAEARLGTLIGLMEAFGIEPATTRVTLSRLKKDGWFTTRREGRETVYVLSEHMLGVLREGRERIFSRVDGEWDGWWTQVLYQVPESDRTARESLRKQLTWLGFGQFAPSVWLSPHRTRERVEQLRRDFPGATVDILRSRTAGLTEDLDLARRCWDLGELAEGYRAFIAEYGGLDTAAGLPTAQEALVERTAVVAEARRLTFRDPNLPVELQPRDWPGREAFELFRRVHAGLGPAARTYVESVIGSELPLDQ